MKYLLKACFLLVMVFSASCSSDDESLAAIDLQGDELDFTVTQNAQKDNEVVMRSMEDSYLSYWSYTDEDGNELGHSNNSSFEVNLPFAGTYYVMYKAFTQGGAIEAEPVQISVSANDEEFFSDPQWGMLTNGIEGKTWVLDMSSPVGFGGLDFPRGPEDGDYWNWYPDYAGNEWVMEDKDWGEMTLNLDGGYNISVTKTALNSDEQSTETGSFNYNLETQMITLNGGVEVLFGGDYYPDVSNWSSVEVIELSENEMRLAVIRDQSRSGEGNAKIIFHYRVQE